MFYENDRIIRKQARFVNYKAIAMIDRFKAQKLDDDAIIASLELLLDDESNEMQIDIVSRALVIMKKED